MAFADKCTTMQRVAIIYKGNGAIKYEGVLIEGVFLLQESTWLTEFSLIKISKDNINDFIEGIDDEAEYILVYQDTKAKMWCPRESSKEYLDYIKQRDLDYLAELNKEER